MLLCFSLSLSFSVGIIWIVLGGLRCHKYFPAEASDSTGYGRFPFVLLWLLPHSQRRHCSQQTQWFPSSLQLHAALHQSSKDVGECNRRGPWPSTVGPVSERDHEDDALFPVCRLLFIPPTLPGAVSQQSQGVSHWSSWPCGARPWFYRCSGQTEGCSRQPLRSVGADHTTQSPLSGNCHGNTEGLPGHQRKCMDTLKASCVCN